MDKAELRARLRDSPGPDRETVGRVQEGLFRWMSERLPGTVAAYLAMTDEIDVEPLFGRLPGWQWVLPRIEADRSLTLRDRDLDRETHAWGMAQPVDSGDAVPVHQLDLVLVPGLAFDHTGARLGRGGGYYDRLLEGRRTDCLAVGVTWEARITGLIPTEQHDRRVDFIATEAGVMPRSPTS